MYAIVEIAGHQYKVQKDMYVYTQKLHVEAGTDVVLDQVLLIDNDGKIAVGAPVVSGAQVKATVVDHVRGDKVIVFKKKRRKGYKKKNGHRQHYSKLVINEIVG